MRRIRLIKQKKKNEMRIMVPGRIDAFSRFWDQDKLQNGRTEMRLQFCESRLIYL